MTTNPPVQGPPAPPAPSGLRGWYTNVRQKFNWWWMLGPILVLGIAMLVIFGLKAALWYCVLVYLIGVIILVKRRKSPRARWAVAILMLALLGTIWTLVPRYWASWTAPKTANTTPHQHHYRPIPQRVPSPVVVVAPPAPPQPPTTPVVQVEAAPSPESVIAGTTCPTGSSESPIGYESREEIRKQFLASFCASPVPK